MGEGIKKTVRILLTNLLMVICSIPVITAGAAIAAAFYVNLKLAGGEDVSVVKMFFSSFKQNFLQGTLMWIITLPFLAGLGYMWFKLLSMKEFSLLFVIGSVLLTFIFFIVFIYTFPLIARYNNTLANQIRNSIGITVQNFKSTLILIVKVLVEIAISYVVLGFFGFMIIPLLVMIAPAVIISTISEPAKEIFTDLESKA